MSVRVKTFLLVLAATISFGVIAFAIALRILVRPTLAQEQEITAAGLRRVLALLNEEHRRLQEVAHDYATRDDVAAACASTPAAPQSPLFDVRCMAFNRLAFAALVNRARQPVLVYGFDAYNRVARPAPAAVLHLLQPGSLALDHAREHGVHRGVLLGEEEPLLVVTLPVVGRRPQDPPCGELLLGRSLDARVVEAIEAGAGYRVTVWPVSAAALPPDIAAARASLRRVGDTWVCAVDTHTIAGYALLPDLTGQPALVVKASGARPLYDRIRFSMRFFLLFFAATGLAFVVLLVEALDVSVLARLLRLGQFLRGVSTDRLGERVTTQGHDEIADLGRRINDMLATLQRDLEARREAQATARTCEARTHTLLDSVAGVAVLGYGPDGLIHYWNEASTRLFGYAAAEALGQPLAELLFPPGQRDRIQAVIREAPVTGRMPEAGEVELLCRDGRRVPVFASHSIVRVEGQPPEFYCLGMDLSERHSVEDALRESEGRLKLLLDSIPTGVLVVDAETHIIRNVNPAAERIVGAPRDAIIGQICHAFVCPAAAGKCPVTDLGQCVDNAERVLLRADGGQVPILKTVVPIQLQGRAYLLESFVDISALKHTQTALHQAYADLNRRAAELEANRCSMLSMLEDLELSRRKLQREMERANEYAVGADAANRAKSEFLANMSHEIRTPMNAVVGLTGLLLQTPLSHEQRDYVETISSSGDALLSLINDILDFSKIEAGKLTIEPEQFDLVSTVEGALDLLAERAAAKGLETMSSIAADVPTALKGDASRIRQILINLISNGIKFTDRGEVVVRVTRDAREDARVWVRFEVQDTGIGISEAAQTRLFQSFSQVDNSAARRYGGTGLGLVISRRLVEIMGGEMGLRSGAGEGSTFWFTIPLEASPGAVCPPPPPVAPDVLEKLRVLVVDDNVTNLLIVERQIAAWGVRVERCERAQTALETLRRAAAQGQPFTLLLLDMAMPEMDGGTLTQIVKADPALQPTRIVIMSSWGHTEETARFRDLEGVRLLTKPLKQSLLWNAIATLLAPPAAAAAPSAAPPSPPPDTAAVALATRILLAEDNSVNQKVALRQLAKLGYVHVDAVANGVEALEALHRARYDLVLMDCQMPEMDGYETTRRVRVFETQRSLTGKDGRRIPIIAMTAHAMEGDREKCLEAGMDDYVPKPIRFEDLKRALLRWNAPPPAGS